MKTIKGEILTNFFHSFQRKAHHPTKEAKLSFVVGRDNNAKKLPKFIISYSKNSR